MMRIIVTANTEPLHIEGMVIASVVVCLNTEHLRGLSAAIANGWSG